MIIRNKTTGEIKEINPTEASTYGLSAPEPQESNKILDFLAPRTLKAASTLSNIPTAWKKTAEEWKQNGPFAAPSPELRELYGGSSVDTGSRFLNAGLDAWKNTQTSSRAGIELGSLASILKNVGTWATKKVWPAVRYPTLKGAYGASTNAAAEAGEAGKTIDLNKVIKNAQGILEKGTQPGRAKLTEVIAKAFPEEATKVSPSTALETRGLLTKSLPNGFFEKISSSLADIIQGPGAATERAAAAEASNAFRQALTNEIHDIVPKTVTPDRAYAIWKSVGGDLPAWAKGILKYQIGKRFLPRGIQQYLP